MVAPSVASDKPAAKSGRRRPLIVGLIVIVVASAGYLGWQHFAHSPGAAVPEPPPPVPVIAATVQKQNYPIVLTGIGNVAFDAPIEPTDARAIADYLKQNYGG
jgi:hypothetical protein